MWPTGRPVWPWRARSCTSSWPATTGPPWCGPRPRTPLARVAAVLSEADAAAMVEAQRREGEAELRALVSRPDRHRPTAEGLHLFVNGRPVRDRLLRHALLEPYRDVLPRGRFPAAVLFLRLPPEAVDVNVHPAKWEVRFADPRAIHHLVSQTVKQALAQRGWLGAAPGAGASAGSWTRLVAADRVAERGVSDWMLASSAAPPRSPADGAEAASAAPTATSAAVFPEAGLRLSQLRLLGQLQCTYLLLETAGALLLVDQHAAHERVLYERLRAAWAEGGVAQQPLLLPVTLDLAPAMHAALAERADAITSLGFEVEPFGDAAVVVRAVPALLAGHDPAELVRGLAEELLAAQRDDATADAGRALAAAGGPALRQPRLPFRAEEGRRPRPARAARAARGRGRDSVGAVLSPWPAGRRAHRSARRSSDASAGADGRPRGAVDATVRRVTSDSENDRPPVVVLTGPTASGKTAAALRLAKRFDLEVVSADSMQVYRYLDIGTAKPSLAERAQVPHHMIDVVPPDVDYNAGRYAREARAAAADIHRRGRLVLLVGGTGLYIRAFLEGLLSDGAADRALREVLEREHAASRGEGRSAGTCTGAWKRSIPRRRRGSIPTTCAASCARWSWSGARARRPRACAALTASATGPIACSSSPSIRALRPSTRASTRAART